MYLGGIVELAESKRLNETPRHPYTEALLSAVPEPDPEFEARREHIILKGDVPSPANPPDGCNFCTRCPQVMEVCRRIDPEMREVAPGHVVACHLHDPAYARTDHTKTAGATAAGTTEPNIQQGE